MLPTRLCRVNMRRKRILQYASVVAAISLLAACGSSNGNTPGSGQPGAAKSVKVGLILEDRPESDPWAAAWDTSIKAVVKKDPAVSYKEAYNANSPTDAQPVIQQLLGSGTGAMLMTSYTLSDIATSVQSQYPNVPMAVSSFQGTVPPNLSVVTASYLQIGYVNCWLLAKLSKTGKVGYTNGLPVPFATELLQGCQLGAAAANPSSKVLVAYTNSFADQQAGVIQAKSLLNQGADVLWPASGEGDTQGVYQLCEQQHIPCAGWGGDTRQWAPNTAVITAQLNWTGFIDKLIDQYRTQNLSPMNYDATYANGGVSVPPFEGAPGALVPANVQTEFKQMLADMIAGKIQLPKSTAHPSVP